LILDEPASGLDPRARVEIRSLLLELQRMGKTILISSHILSDIGEICNRVGIIESGRMVVEGTISELLERVPASSVVHVRVSERADAAAAQLAELPFVEGVHRAGEGIVLELLEGFDEFWRIADALVEAGFRINSLQPEAKNLEHAFMALTQQSR
jgi:ABC-2 type transport system ATP-binding protein